MKIGKRLKAEIKKQNLSARQFAKLAGVSVDTVYKYYTMSNVDNDKMEKWSEILKISANDFMKDINLILTFWILRMALSSDEYLNAQMQVMFWAFLLTRIQPSPLSRSLSLISSASIA